MKGFLGKICTLSADLRSLKILGAGFVLDASGVCAGK